MPITAKTMTPMEQYRKYHRLAAEAMERGDQDASDKNMRLAYHHMKLHYSATDHTDDGPRLEDATDSFGRLPSEVELVRKEQMQQRRYGHESQVSRGTGMSDRLRAEAAIRIATRCGISFSEALDRV